MIPVKKSFNMEADLAQQMDDFLNMNPGVSATFVMNQAIKQWLKNPSFKLNQTQATDEDVDQFLRENSDLMDDLAK